MTISTTAPLVMVVDDDPEFAALICRWLNKDGFDTTCCHSAESMMQALTMNLPDVVCLDIGLPGKSGLEVLPLLRKRHKTVPVILLTGEKDVNVVVAAMREGAFDFISKPPERTHLLSTVGNAVNSYIMSTRIVQLEREAQSNRYGNIVGQSAPMLRLFRQLDKIAASDISVLIHGESGTGKELVARAVHQNSSRANGALVEVNCAAIPEALQESEFFGHEKGAFTGAIAQKPGKFEISHGGSLFLDEIGELSLPLQAKLLRVLQEHRFERVGGTRTIQSDFRLVAATHQNLSSMVIEKLFREDLFFRVAVLELEVPPLRERQGDVSLLIDEFLKQISTKDKAPITNITPEARNQLELYQWPGNVRELQNVIQRAVVICEDNLIQKDDLPPRVNESIISATTLNATDIEKPQPKESIIPDLKTDTLVLPDLDATPLTLEEIERWAIESMMKKCNGNASDVIRKLGIGRTTLYRKLKQYGLR